MKTTNPRILTINGGSSSIKFALFDAGDPLRRILDGAIERIGLPEGGGSQQVGFYPIAKPPPTGAK